MYPQTWMSALGAAGLIAYRAAILAPDARRSTESLSAASITTIEAAFIRDGAAGVAATQRAAERCGRPITDADALGVYARLRAKGFTHPDAARNALRAARFAGIALLIVASALQLMAEPLGTHAVRDVLLVCAGVAFVLVMTHLDATNAPAQAALAVRRAAYPVELVREADVVEAVALYGGTLRDRRDREAGDGWSGDDGNGAYVWAGDRGGSHGDGGGHSSSGDACGSSSCGGH